MGVDLVTVLLGARAWGDAAWIIVVCSLLLAGGVALLVLVWLGSRRWLKQAWSPEDSGEPWTLHDLRQMRDEGAITEEEFQAMRSAMIRAHGGRESSAGGTDPEPDN